MAFQPASAHSLRARDARRSWMNALRALAGAASMAGAFWVATHYALDRARFVVLLLGGFGVFTFFLLGLGRDVARRWLEFGRALGFAPVVRRPILEFGTDRPALQGMAGAHCARLRLVDVGEGRDRAEWLLAELEILADPSDPTLGERAARLGARVREGRVYVGRAFSGMDELAAREFLADAARMADELERPA